MSKFISGLALSLCFLSLSAEASLVSEYTFDQGYQDVNGNGPDLVSLGGETVNGQYLFGDGKGVQLSLPDGDAYAVEIAFNYNAILSYQYGAFMSFGSIKENQLYIVDRKLVYYGYGKEFRTGPELFSGEDIVFGLSRSVGGEFSYYLNGVEILTNTDPAGALSAGGANPLISFFSDNTAENISGSIYYIKTYSNEAGLSGNKSIVDAGGPLMGGAGLLFLMGTTFVSRREKLLIK